jgi:hypothetical protein
MSDTYQQLEVEPLGGPHYQGKFWPLTADDAEQVETTLGWQLPTTYREFATTFGICTPSGELLLRIKSQEIEDPQIGVFFGSNPGHSLTYSLLNWASIFPGPRRLLGFCDATTGLFLMAPDESIMFQFHRYEVLYEAADSFSDFLSRLYPDPEAD